MCNIFGWLDFLFLLFNTQKPYLALILRSALDMKK